QLAAQSTGTHLATQPQKKAAHDQQVVPPEALPQLQPSAAALEASIAEAGQAALENDATEKYLNDVTDANALTAGDKAALLEYQANGYKIVNTELRDPGVSLGMGETQADVDAAKKLTRELDDYFGNRAVRTDKPITLYRGSLTSSPQMAPALDNLKEARTWWNTQLNKTLQDKGFVSTTTSEKVAHNFAADEDAGIVYVIAVPTGTPVAYMSKLGQQYKSALAEREVILPRDMRFTVRGVTRDTEGAVVVRLDARLAKSQAIAPPV